MTIKTSQRKAALGALFTLLDGLPLQPNAIRRNSSLPERLSEHAMVFLRDGDMTQVDVTLSPVTYLWEHAASIEIYVAHPEASARDARMDELLQALGTLILADPTLSGQIDHTEVMPPKFEDVTPEGSVGIKACTLDVVMHYASSHPLA